MNQLRVLRQVDGEIVGLAGTEPKVPGFPEYLDNDHPRHSFLSEEIAERTIGFAITDGEKILHKFESLEDAEKARGSAKLTFGIELPSQAVSAPAPDDSKANDGSTPEAPRADGSYGSPQASAPSNPE